MNKCQMKYLRGQDEMRMFYVWLRMVLSLKIEMVFTIVFSCILIVYCSNPYAVNPAEFTLYTKYLIPIGVCVWLLVSLRLHLLITNSVPIDWIAINEIVERPKKIVANQISIAFLCFSILQMLIAGIIASAIIIAFSSGWDLFAFIFKLYLIYYALPFAWAWVTGLSISVVYVYYSRKRAVLFICVFLLWIITLFYLEYGLVSFNVFIENRWPYIDPLLHLTFLKENMLVKLAYFICSIGVCFILMKVRRNIIGISISVILIIFVTFTTYNVQNKSQLDKILLANDYKLYHQIKNETHGNIKMTDNWRITGVQFEPESRYPIQIELTLDKKEHSC